MNDSLLKTLENSRPYTLAVAEAMPEKSYLFKPAKDVWNFKELIEHIAYGILWWEENYISGSKSDWNPPPAKDNKLEVVNYLMQAYNLLERTVSKRKLDEHAIHGFHATLDHITHHRGQAVTYLRCQGITAPEYTY